MGRSEIEAGGGSVDRQWLNSSSWRISGRQTPINCRVYTSEGTMSFAVLRDLAGFGASMPLSVSHRSTNRDAVDLAAAK
jgi:hypothetical protein